LATFVAPPTSRSRRARLKLLDTQLIVVHRLGALLKRQEQRVDAVAFDDLPPTLLVHATTQHRLRAAAR